MPKTHAVLQEFSFKLFIIKAKLADAAEFRILRYWHPGVRLPGWWMPSLALSAGSLTGMMRRP